MRRPHRLGGILAALAVLLAASFGAVPPARAEGGFALSGNFYRQEFSLPQGTALYSPDIYVVVFNNSESPFKVQMQTESPDGVKVSLSEQLFPLKPGEQKTLVVGIEVADDAVPGEYRVTVIAEAHKETTGGIQLLGASAQRAKLQVTGDSGSVVVRCQSPNGDPVPAIVKLLRLAQNRSYERGHSDDGIIETKLAPGDYVASAYMGDEKLAEESFSISANEVKRVDLIVSTVYIEGFGVVPTYSSESGKLAFAKIVYTLNNLYKAFPRTEMMLQVQKDGQVLDEMSIATLDPLEKGRMGANYSYIPADGWQAGIYQFRVLLLVNNEQYTASPVVDLLVEKRETSGSGLPIWAYASIGLVLLAALVVAGVLLTRGRQRRSGG